MLIRPTNDGTFQCVDQEHHAFLSGVLAGAWLPTSLEAELVQAIGLHDDPWRGVDAEPTYNPETGVPFDFVEYPVDEKVEFYRSGLDELERVHPWVAYLVSRHYTTFAGTKDVEALTEPERERRDRLEARLRESLVASAARSLAWLKYFDVFSLYVVLAGPAAREGSVPRWLREPGDWAEAPDGTPVELEWRDDQTVALEPWPFAAPSLTFDVRYRRLEGRSESEAEFRREWSKADRAARRLEFVSVREDP